MHTLGWHIKEDNKGFLEANTANFDFWLWTDKMISLLIDDNKVLINSIGNADTFAAQSNFLGQNSKNITLFQVAI